MQYHVFHYISCCIVEIWITFRTVYGRLQHRLFKIPGQIWIIGSRLRASDCNSFNLYSAYASRASLKDVKSKNYECICAKIIQYFCVVAALDTEKSHFSQLDIFLPNVSYPNYSLCNVCMAWDVQLQDGPEVSTSGRSPYCTQVGVLQAFVPFSQQAAFDEFSLLKGRIGGSGGQGGLFGPN